MLEFKSSFAKATEDILRRRVAPFLQAKKGSSTVCDKTRRKIEKRERRN